MKSRKLILLVVLLIIIVAATAIHLFSKTYSTKVAYTCYYRQGATSVDCLEGCYTNYDLKTKDIRDGIDINSSNGAGLCYGVPYGAEEHTFESNGSYIN